MSDDVVRLSVIWQIVCRRWRLLAVVAAVGALLGGGASLLFSPGYQSASSVLLQCPLEDEELQTEAQIAMSSIVLDRTVAALGLDVTGDELRGSVSAEVVDGNVIQISGSAESADRAQQLTDRLTQEYVTFSSELVNRAAGASAQVVETLQRRVADTDRRVAELQGSAAPGTVENAQDSTELEGLRTTLADAITKLEEIGGGEQRAEAGAAFGRARILVLEPAALPSGPAAPTLVQFIAGGAVLLFLLGVLAHVVAARTDRRLWSTAEISAALGSPVVGSVDIPDGTDDPAAQRQPGSRSWRARMWRLVRDDRPWDAPPVSGSDLDRDVRCRRVLARLRGAPGAGLRLLVLVADDDATAHRAAAQLAVAAGVDGSDPAPGNHRTVLHVVDVSATRPTVPDCGHLSGALVVITAGTRTAWELVGIAEACADVGHHVVGAVVTNRTRLIEHSPEVSSNGRAMAGST
ncbi:MAG: exopolysaccharide biosynthesis protein [Pseudonocardiaceae bacterium]|nr:exopolysaccharide biosynthesis protein [Pseudonocardiaceae bacterium]